MRIAAPIQFVDLKAQYRVFEAEVKARIHAVLEHGQYIRGPEVSELEERLKNYTGAKHCITVVSGTEVDLVPTVQLQIIQALSPT